MSNSLIVLALLASLAATLDIRKGSITNKPLFENYFPSDSEENQYEKSMIGNSNDLLEIYRTVRSWKIDAKVSQDFTTKQSLTLDQGGYVYKHFYFRSPTSQVMRLYYNPKTIQPGIVIQLSDSNDYSRGLIPHYLAEDKRNPFNIRFSNGLTGRIEDVTNAGYNKKLNERIREDFNKFNKKNIELYIYKFQEIEAALRNLGLPASAYQDLLLSPKNPGEQGRRRTTIVLLQPLFSVQVDFPKTSNNKRMNLVEAIFSLKYKFDQFMGTATYGYWKYNNLPQIVSQANYGRLLIMTLQENKMSQNQIQALLGCYNEDKFFNEDCFDSAMIKIQSNPSIRSYVGGINPIKAYEQRRNLPILMQSVNWRKVFFEFNSPDQVEQLEPLSANMMNLLGQKYIQIDTLRFYTVTKNKYPNIEIRVEEVSFGADFSYRIVGSSEDVWISGLTSPQVMEAGNRIGWNEFTLIVAVKGVESKKWYSIFTGQSSQYRFRLVMNVIINGQEVLKIRQNSKSRNSVLNLSYRLKTATEQ